MNKTESTSINEFQVKTHVHHHLKMLGVILWLTGCVRLYKDGSFTFSAVFRIWHPVTWLVLVLMTPLCAIFGEKLLDVVPLRLPKFWKDNEDQLQWVHPWMPLKGLKEFDLSRSKQPVI